MQSKQIVLVLGGTRSGKSAFAERLAAQAGGLVTYIATAVVTDPEMARRVAAHRIRRPEYWRTVEESLNLAGAVRLYGHDSRVILIDCLSVWLGNILYSREEQPPEHVQAFVEQQVDELSVACREVPAGVIMVASEVGLGVVPAHPLGRLFRDLAGMVNQRLAAVSDRVYLVVAGLAVDLRQLAGVTQLCGEEL
ncbi:bifunctional adenosylcobinamide kinase/adenosylcobinamide-phosphate guanylyltransferase [Desulfurispora thermophila]|uniref:bifunctional adenosylcobinamide kinase/adenosylcobinamide-phosphate guanylyltransferase n=1 Tax=Desulfurispora thermophila TaxID=265470 RepID=UPI00037C6964|nr:bifunctional adenosylcobinamide kinase/adenosylcobinamide-phosphate guanylyltransferase [Desulfurispora thermophila]